MPNPSILSPLGVLLTSSVVASLVTTGVGWARDRLKTKRDDKFAALYLALTLEAYAAECATFLGDAETWISSNHNAGQSHGNLPELPVWPEDIDWKALGIDDTTRALTFAATVASTRSHISGWYEFDDEGPFFAFRQRTAQLGRRALQLAQELRLERGLKPAEQATDWSIETYLDECISKYADIERRDRQDNEDWAAELVEKEPSKEIADGKQQVVPSEATR